VLQQGGKLMASRLGEIWDAIAESDEGNAEKFASAFMEKMGIAPELDSDQLIQNAPWDDDVEDDVAKELLSSLGLDINFEDVGADTTAPIAQDEKTETKEPANAEPEVDLTAVEAEQIGDQTPKVEVVTTDNIDTNEEDTLFNAVQAMTPEQRKAFLGRFEEVDLADAVPFAQTRSREASEKEDAMMRPAIEDPEHAVRSGNALAKLIGSLKF
jgi:hypothetical protein